MKAIRLLDFLTDRERVVLGHMMNGLTAEQIAGAEYITVATVRSHIRMVLVKLNVHSQLAAVAHAYQHCWNTEDERHAVLERVLGTAPLGTRDQSAA